MSTQLIDRLIAAAAETIYAHVDELTRLDQAIGDGDHGLNMKRGFKALLESRDELSQLPFGPALSTAGMTLVMKVGGASGPLFGSFLLAAGKVADEMPANSNDVVTLLDAGIAAVKARGKSDVGAKTMLDVLVPLQQALVNADDDFFTVARRSADSAVAKTKDMRATKGRASFLGERSVGHIDPGARSVALLVHAVCDVMEVP